MWLHHHRKWKKKKVNFIFLLWHDNFRPELIWDLGFECSEWHSIKVKDPLFYFFMNISISYYIWTHNHESMDQNLFFSHSGSWLDQLLAVFLIISPHSILDGLIFDIISDGAFSFLHFEWTSFSENLRLIGAKNIKIWGEGYFKICIFHRSENERCLLFK